MHLPSDLMKEDVALERTAEDRKEWQKNVKSWKSYTCFSADYLCKAVVPCQNKKLF